MSKYIHGERQRAAMIQAGIDLWHQGGEAAVTARAVGKIVGRSHAGVLFHFEGVADLKHQVKSEGIARGDVRIIQSLLVANDPLVSGWTDEQRVAWMNASAG